jgi:hypothetical protein
MDKLMKQTQRQRWVKYGLNVALTSAVVVLIAVAVVYLAQRRPMRFDTTQTRSHSLKPQTLNILKGLEGNAEGVELVSLYRPPEDRTDKDEQDFQQAVSDLLDQYERASGRIKVDRINPRSESGKLDALIKRVNEKYGAELAPYIKFLDGVPGFVTEFGKFAGEQAEAIKALPMGEIRTPELAETIELAQASVEKMPERLADLQGKRKRRLERNIPDYRGAVDDVKAELGALDVLMTRVTADLRSIPKAAPEAVRKYAESNLPAYEAATKRIKEEVEKADALGELKLDALRESIRQDAILVMGPKEMRVLAFADVWQAPGDLRSLAGANPVRPKLRFAGEQQVSTSIVAVTAASKPRVILVRPAGPPLGTSFMRPAQFSAIARRLREANFEVLEKDLSGQFAMQAQMQGMPVSEATDEQMRDRSAVWMVFSLVERMSQMGPNPIPGALRQHLEEGGSAVVLVEPEMDGLDDALNPFGIKVRSDAVVVKAVSREAGAAGGDIVKQAEFIPYIFLTRDYGRHALARPVSSLEGLLVAPVPVEATTAAGRTVTPLLPITRVVRTWGETNIRGLFDRDSSPPEFDSATDISNTDASPLSAGVAVEVVGGAGEGAGGAATRPSTQPVRKQRIVVLGSVSSFSNNIASIADPDLIKQGLVTARFPGNTELLLNSVYWLSDMETMLAISPAAMEVPRIRDIPPTQLALIRYGLLIGGLPLLALLAGLGVYLSRRE